MLASLPLQSSEWEISVGPSIWTLGLVGEVIEHLGGGSLLEEVCVAGCGVLRSYCSASLLDFSLFSAYAWRCDCPVSCFSCPTIINLPIGTTSQNKLFSPQVLFDPDALPQQQKSDHHHTLSHRLPLSVPICLGSCCPYMTWWFHHWFLTNLRLVSVLCSYVFMLGPELSLRATLQSKHWFCVSLRSSELKDDLDPLACIFHTLW